MTSNSSCLFMRLLAVIVCPPLLKLAAVVAAAPAVPPDVLGLAVGSDVLFAKATA